MGDNERWLPYNYRGIIYSVSDTGRIIGSRGKELKTRVNKDGYEEVSLGQTSNRNGRVKVHRLVAELFVDNPDSKPEVNHKDYNRSNNHFSNLEWVTHEDNISYSVNAGHYFTSKRRGAGNGRARLTDADVVNILALLSSGSAPTDIARTYSVGSSTIYNIKLGNTWKHIPRNDIRDV